ncbi:MAG: gamma-glutamyltransferase [Krumholzibacteria bacterium]|nr:gamma-glutamyltransferase [Candidatus Krumholzibacteria bacterium]
MRRNILIACLGLLAAASVAPRAAAADRVTGQPFATRSEVIAPHAMAATSQPLATQIALEILRQGGSAVDAAIAANAALGLMEPTGCGIGGDLFAIVWDPGTRRLHGLNASGRSPRALGLEEFRKRGLTSIPPFGVLPVSVPGCVDGWFELHAKFGRLPMDQVLAPAIRYAREGFPVSELIAHYWQLGVAARADQPFFLETFTRDGHTPAKGELWTNEALARTYETLARDGRDAFYRGDLARTIVRTVQDAGGFLAAADLAGHRSEWVDPVSANYRGVDVWELPPNGQGIAALQILNILEGFDLAGLGFGSPGHVHAFVEAKKLAFADRARFYADPDFARMPVAELISKEYAAGRRARIDPERAARSVEAGNPALREGDTIYLAVADRDRMMVSLIQSNYRGLGSGVCPEGLGFGLQDRGELFTLEPGQANTYAPGKRPFHTIIPAFVTRDSEPWISFGVMGGGTQPQAHAQIIMNLVDFGMNLQEAGDAPRILHWGDSEPTGEVMTDGGNVALEQGFPYATRRALTQMGHRLVTDVGSFGGYQAILLDPEQGVYYGASESRKDGQAAGY